MPYGQNTIQMNCPYGTNTKVQIKRSINSV